MTPNDLIRLAALIMGWVVAIFIFVFTLAILFVAFIMAVEVGIICWKEVEKNVRKK